MYYSYDSVCSACKVLPNLKQNSDRNLLRFLAEIPGHEESWEGLLSSRRQQVSEAFPRYAQ